LKIQGTFSVRGKVTSNSRGFNVAIWVARTLGFLFLALVSIGWWDESLARQDLPPGGESQGFLWEWAVFTHLLPLVLIAVGYLLGWRMPWIASVAFLVYAGLQAMSVGTEWVYLPIVVLPPLLVSVMFFVAWRLGRK
jgi:hypothetical protein